MAEDWIDAYRRDGCAVLKDVLPAGLIDAHVAACDRILRTHGLISRASPDGDPNGALFPALRDLGVDNPASRPLHLHPGLRRHVATLLGDEEPVLVGSTTNIWEKGREPHSDTLMLFRDPPGQVCRTWCALEDIDPACSAFYVIPGTQRTVRPLLYDDVLRDSPEVLGILRACAPDAHLRWEDNRLVWGKLRAATAARVAGLERRAFAPRKGDVVVFDPNAIHGTMPATDQALTRKAIIAEWHARSVRSYPASAYFGAQLDRRGTVEAASARDGAACSPLGLYVPQPAG